MTRTRRTQSSSSQDGSRYFTKHGNSGQNPNELKKKGAGKGNWGTSTQAIEDELRDLMNDNNDLVTTPYHYRNRSSNSMSNGSDSSSYSSLSLSNYPGLKASPPIIGPNNINRMRRRSNSQGGLESSQMYDRYARLDRSVQLDSSAIEDEDEE